MSTLVGFLAAATVVTCATVLGKLIGIDMSFPAGWFACRAFYGGCRWFERSYSRRAK